MRDMRRMWGDTPPALISMNDYKEKIAMPRDFESIVTVFSKHMVERLEVNRAKGGWQNESNEYLFGRLVQESGKLFHELIHGDDDAVINKAANIANFAMMIADNFYGNLWGEDDESVS